MRSRGNFRVTAVHFGLLDQQAGPCCAHDTIHTKLVLNIGLVRCPSEATFSLGSSLGVPTWFEVLDRFEVILV